MVGLKGHFSCNLAPFFPCVLFLWVARSCAGLYFYAFDYPSWVSTVMVFRNTSILQESGWLQMNPYTNATVGRALYKTTFQMQNSTNGSLSSFNTSFVFSMNTDRGKEYYGDGLAFLICPNPFRGEDLQVSSGGYLGMFNSSTVGMLRNKVFAVEFDTHQNIPFKDPNDNHIGVDLNSVISLKTNNLSTLGIVLNEGKKLVCWVDYDGLQRYLWVYLAHSPSDKPSSPAIAMALDLAPYMKDNMYVGFSSATGTRAELHTVHSWWFLAGFGNLTLPLSPSSSTRPLAKLGQRNIVIAVFSLAVMVGFLCLLCIYARRRWRRHLKHLIDILLPVACWMFWKESISSEVRSTRCLKLATPTVELLAWLWRTRLAREHEQLHVMTWWEVLLKHKLGLYHSGEAWHMEDKERKQRKPHGAVHFLVFEEASDEDSHDETSPRGRVKVIKHIKMHQPADRKGEGKEVLEREDEAPPLAAAGQQCESKMQEGDRPVHKRSL
ncbi:hypothetical protein GOP47_0010745 [Adiantum capillus-veneris]|uniref:Legume lectin domain-containing protein n=1 Tax=Adiantum capillus-veneris TaxID=13818 RepID=A0A9D4ZGP4_ADICA|nr:hypothetical protein GOP47_0010745 [Adiantum capillus-veneris]